MAVFILRIPVYLIIIILYGAAIKKVKKLDFGLFRFAIKNQCSDGLLMYLIQETHST